MSNTQSVRKDRLWGRREKWPRPEESCGQLVTALPDGKSVWTTIGPAAKLWQSLSRRIQGVAQGEEFVSFHVTFHFYMIGRKKSKASPHIIFCSPDSSARRTLRNFIRTSGILNDYPSISLGDSTLVFPASFKNDKPMLPPSLKPAQPEPVQDSHADTASLPEASCESLRSSPASHTSAALDKSQGNKIGCVPAYNASLESFYGGNTTAISHRSWELISCQSSMDPSTTMEPLACSSATIRAQPKFRSFPSKDAARRHYEEQPLSPFPDKPNIRPPKPAPFPESSGEDEGTSDGESDSTTLLDTEDPIYRETRNIVTRLLREFQLDKQGRKSHPPEEPESSRNPSGCTIRQGTNLEKTAQPSKPAPKKRQPENGASSDGEDSGLNVAAKPKKRKPNRREACFACPFWKRDPQQYSACHTKTLKEVRHVKQHLYRAHTNPIRCPICQDIFPTVSAQQAHIRQQRGACTMRDPEPDVGITPDQRIQLAGRAPKGTSCEDQWFLVWDILFAPLCRPATPWLNADLVEEMNDFSEFYHRRGPDILHACLWRALGSDAAPGLHAQMLDRQRSDHALRAALCEIHRLWLAERRSTSDEARAQDQLDVGNLALDSSSETAPSAARNDPMFHDDLENLDSESNRVAANVGEFPEQLGIDYGYSLGGENDLLSFHNEFVQIESHDNHPQPRFVDEAFSQFITEGDLENYGRYGGDPRP